MLLFYKTSIRLNLDVFYPDPSLNTVQLNLHFAITVLWREAIIVFTVEHKFKYNVHHYNELGLHLL